MNPSCICLFSLSFLLLGNIVSAAPGSPGQAAPGVYLTAPYGPNGTWNLYRTVALPLSWQEAQARAVATEDPLGGSKKPGHLVAISSGAENMFVYSHILAERVWIGLVDADHENRQENAVAPPHQGWAWTSGEALTFDGWATDEPGRTGDASVVALQRFGWWSAYRNEESVRAASMIEWDVQSPTPVEGATVISAILPKTWPAIEKVPAADANKPWLVVQTHAAGADGWGRLDELTRALSDHWKDEAPFRLAEISCRMRATITGNGFGWIFKDGEFPGASSRGFGMLCRATLNVPKAGTYTFNVHADDGYAIRVGNHTWKAVHGQGGIDPQDPTVLYYSLFSPDGDSRGIIDLPQGDVPVEVFYFNVGLDGALQVMTAEGEYPLDGSTADWRLLGHVAQGKISYPGVDATGWKIRVSPPNAAMPAPRRLTVDTALATVVRAPDVPRVDAVNFNDPESPGRPKFPDAKPYPNDEPNGQDNRLVVAEATLVIPQDGVWHIGARADDSCILQIEGQAWRRTVKDVSGSQAKVLQDTITIDGNALMPGDAELIGEIQLKQGTYSIRIISMDRRGPSVFQVFGAPAGFPPRVLVKQGASTNDDHAGLAVTVWK